jgi:hypothetical protein
MSRRLLWLSLAAGLGLRLLAWLLVGDKLPTYGYEAGVISSNIVEGRGYTMPFYFTDIPLRSFIPPFYPVLLTLAKLATSHWESLLRVLQIFVSLANALLAAEIAGRWFGRRAMVWSYLLVLFYPLFVLYCLSIFSTTFIMTWVLILVNLMDRVQGPTSVRLGALTGLVHALGILTSPPLALLGILFLFRFWRFPSPRRNRRLAAYLVTLALVWSPWIVRNAVVHRDLLLTSTNGGFNFLVGNNPYAGGYAWGDLTEETFWEVIDRDMVAQLPEPKLEYWFYGRAFQYIRQDPLHYAGFFLKKIYYFWWRQITPKERYPYHWGLAYQGLYAVFLPFILVGIWLWRDRWRRLFPAYFLFAEYTLLYASYFVRSRFRWEIEPLLMIFAVAGFFEIRRRLGGDAAATAALIGGGR